MIALKTMRYHSRHACQSITGQKVSIKTKASQNFMLAWKVNDSLNNANDVDVSDKLICTETKIPTLSLPSDVLVKIRSTSINPLDVKMLYGYGRRVLDLLDIATNFEPRITNDRYPLTLGRDFSGEVVAIGPCAKEFKIGDHVFGVVEPQKTGAHAQYITVPSYCLTRKPDNLRHEEAASIPFAAMTAYSALCTFGKLNRKNCDGKQVLVIGGSGGVGSFAIQLLKLWGANVVATCSEEKTEWLENVLFVDQVICHNDASQMDTLVGRFDFVLDCGTYDKISLKHRDMVEKSLKYLKPFSNAVYVTLSPPLLNNIDRHGLILGSVGTAMEAVQDTFKGLRNVSSARWAIFLPNKSALNYISSLYKDEALVAQVSSVFGFQQMPSAFAELQSGKARGKIVVDVSNLESVERTNSTSEKEAAQTAN